MKRRDVVRGIGASATLGLLAGTAAAEPPCHQCPNYDAGDCPDWCTDFCNHPCRLVP